MLIAPPRGTTQHGDHVRQINLSVVYTQNTNDTNLATLIWQYFFKPNGEYVRTDPKENAYTVSTEPMERDGCAEPHEESMRELTIVVPDVFGDVVLDSLVDQLGIVSVRVVGQD